MENRKTERNTVSVSLCNSDHTLDIYLVLVSFRPAPSSLTPAHPLFRRTSIPSRYARRQKRAVRDGDVCSLINGVLYLFLSWFGLIALIRSIVNQPTIGPIVLFVGLSLLEECFAFLPSRHYVAVLFGMFPSIAGERKRYEIPCAGRFSLLRF